MINSERRIRLFYKKMSILFMEFLPFVCVVLMTFAGYCYIFETGWDFPLIDEQTALYRIFSLVMSVAWYLFLLCASEYMGFCILHRAMITFLYLSFLLIYINRWWGLDGMTIPTLFLFTAAGTILSLRVIQKLIIKRIHDKRNRTVH